MNDAGDPDLGPNGLRNYPVINKAAVSGTDLAVTGTLNSLTFLNCNVDFYWSLVGDSTNHGEGQNYIGSTNVTTDFFGNASFSTILFGVSVPVGAVVTATTTDAFGNTSEFSLNRTTVTVNSAPVLTGANNLNPINEDPASNPGTLVSDLIAGHVTDADSGTQFGIAVIAVDNSNGTWQFSTDGGINWSDFGTPSANSARLLAADANTYVRFVPNPNWNGTVIGGITFRAWDQSSGMAAGTADVAGLSTLLDRFSSNSYSRNDGTANWNGAWVENDSNGGGATGGRIQVSGGRLDIRADGLGDWIYRETNLFGANSAVLSFRFDNNLGGGDRVVIQLSDDGGFTYTTLVGGSFTSTSNAGIGSLNFDITPYISANTRIRFLVTTIGANNHLYLDDVQITFSSSATVGTTAYSSATASSDITVIPVNDEQILFNNTGFIVAENSTGNIVTNAMLLATDIDNTAAQLIYKLASVPTVGTLRLNGMALSVSDMFSQADIDAGLLTYDHDGSESFTDSFTFVVDDGAGTSSGGTFAITITPVNDNSPVITSNGGGVTASVSIPENTTAVTTVTATDTDLPAQKLTYSIIGGADAGKFTINSSTGVLIFSAAPDFENPTDVGLNNVYDVIVRASDGSFTDTQSIAVTVTPVNDNNPMITSNGGGVTASVSIPENTTAVTTVIATDADLPAQKLTYSIIGGADAGQFTINSSTGALIFSAAPDFENPTDIGLNNVYDVIVRASDGSFTDTQNIVVTVTNVNVAPVAANDNYTVAEDNALAVLASGVLGNDGDADGDGLTTFVVSRPTHGTLDFYADGSFTYIPYTNFSGFDSFAYQASDGVAVSSVAMATINVTPVNDAPIAVADSYTVTTDTTLTIAAVGVLSNDSDIDDPRFTAVLVGTTNNGTVTLNADGSFVYVPNTKFQGTDNFSYRADDGQSASQVVTVTIEVKSAPVVTFPPVIVVGPLTPVPQNPSTTIDTAQPHVITPMPLPNVGTHSGGNGGASNESDSAVADAALVLAPKPTNPMAEVFAATSQLGDRNAVGDRPSTSRSIRTPEPVTPLPTRSAVILAADNPVFTSLEQVAKDVRSEVKVQVVADAVVATGVVVSAGYVLLNTKIVYWFISALLVRPAVWSRFDPIDVLYAWDEDRDNETADSPDDESLQSMVS